MTSQASQAVKTRLSAANPAAFATRFAPAAAPVAPSRSMSPNEEIMARTQAGVLREALGTARGNMELHQRMFEPANLYVLPARESKPVTSILDLFQ